MKMIKTVITMMVMMTASLPLFAEDDETIKVIYQCDFPDVQRVHLMLNTLNNAVKYYQDNFIDYEIDIVTLGPCLQYMMKDFKETGFREMPYLTHGGPAENGTTGRFKSLKMTGGDNIKLFACKNTMNKKNVKPEQLLDIVTTTPAGIIKAIELQRQGYSYIKIQ